MGEQGTDRSTTVRFLGTATVVPGAGQDTACLLLNRDTLVDTGWNAAVNMLQYGCDPLQVDWLFVSHCHHDHYIGLPQLLFYHAMRRHQRPDRPALTVIGPKPDIGLTVDRALGFLQHDRFPDVATPPRVVALQAGDAFETDRLAVTTSPTVHPVVGLCYRFRDKLTGVSVVVTGDTAYHEPISRHAASAELLVHEASYGPTSRDPNAKGGHCGALDAARIAKAAGVRRLCLVHYPPGQRAAVLTAAREIFPATDAPTEGECVTLPAS